MKTLIAKVKQLVCREEGVSAVEYALILALIAVVIIGSVRLMGTHLSSTFTSAAGAI
jgi:pilus assembly protein Flp/PilA